MEQAVANSSCTGFIDCENTELKGATGHFDYLVAVEYRQPCLPLPLECLNFISCCFLNYLKDDFCSSAGCWCSRDTERGY